MYKCVHCQKDKQECGCTSPFTTPEGYDDWRCTPEPTLLEQFASLQPLFLELNKRSLECYESAQLFL